MPFLNPTGHATAADVVAHLEHAIDVCGEDAVGIGTDGTVTGIDDLDAYRVALAEHVADRQAAGVGAAGERADTLPFVLDLSGVDQFHRLIAPARAARPLVEPDREDHGPQLHRVRRAHLGLTRPLDPEMPKAAGLTCGFRGVPPAGFEPAAPGTGNRCSIP